MEAIQCILCHRADSSVVIQENGFSGLQCPSCGLIYISPRPTIREQTRYTQHAQRSHSLKSQISLFYGWRLHEKHNLHRISSYKKTGHLLELGAGIGTFSDQAQKSGFSVHCIEPHLEKADFIRQTTPVTCETTWLQESTLNHRSFDVIYGCDVLSHLYDPVADLTVLHGLLAHDGILVLETGNFADVEKKYFRKIQTFQYPDHLFFFGERSLKKLLHTTGFSVLAIYRYSLMPLLLFNSMCQCIHRFVSRGAGQQSDQPASSRLFQQKLQAQSDQKLSLRSILRRWYSFVSFVLVYNIGFVMPKNGRPQTMIVIARKT
ncbi:MAG: methyltransferase domain-containing protein [Elusimicrobia bacterium]|nr:methyltransferase domain-containing protein [Elusimicrobiota bacterium]MBD3412648.1 methyltransferase domain-containing protein [Elusimicrobiota bacterium]